MQKNLSDQDIDRMSGKFDRQYGDNIVKLTDAAGKGLKYTINKTMMRVELPQTLKPGQQFIFKIEWNYNIIERTKYGGRGGFENFPEDGNDLVYHDTMVPEIVCIQ